jgi:transcriptional regulator with GAF, ATPase, and Fis domain
MAVFVEARQRLETVAMRQNYHGTERRLIGNSPKFRRSLEMVARIAPTQTTVLLIGETGTGKEVLAHEIHRLWANGDERRPFVAVNCAAIPESLFESQLFGHEKGAFTGAIRTHQGYIEQAAGGTLFLDEIGELSTMLQPKLLRFIQEHCFSRVGGNRLLRAEVRLIAATNRNLLEEVKQGRFREDLYHRLAVMPIEIPPLRERREDIRLFAEYYVERFAKSMGRAIHGISDEALIQMERYSWPGNVRELANCLERAVLLCDDSVLLPRHLTLGRGTPAEAPRGPGMITLTSGDAIPIARERTGNSLAGIKSLEQVEREHITAVLDACGGNQMRASDILGIHRNTLRKKLQDWGLSPGG